MSNDLIFDQWSRINSFTPKAPSFGRYHSAGCTGFVAQRPLHSACKLCWVHRLCAIGLYKVLIKSTKLSILNELLGRLLDRAIEKVL